jgi:hypothetical protein
MGMFTSGYYDPSPAELEEERRRESRFIAAEKEFGYYFILDERAPTSICRTCYCLVPGNHHNTQYLAEHKEWHRNQNA